MIDLHCHILPGLDDGPATIEESIAMAESAIADGITHVVATPHSNSRYFFDFLQVRQLRDELQARISGRLNIATGCDFHLNPENLESLRKEPRHFCINQRDFLLVEFNEFSIPPAMDQALHEIQLAGVRPVITHPERNGILRAHPERLKKWVRHGCFAQVTGGALTGGFSAGRFVCNLPTKWLLTGLARRRRALCFTTIRSPRSRGESYRTFRKWRMNCPRRAANVFSFFENSSAFVIREFSVHRAG
jgi:protein-tyrosine phosphatase